MLFFATLVLGGAGALVASDPTSASSLSSGDVPLLLVLDVLFGICMGFVFVWWKKVRAGVLRLSLQQPFAV